MCRTLRDFSGSSWQEPLPSHCPGLSLSRVATQSTAEFPQWENGQELDSRLLTDQPKPQLPLSPPPADPPLKGMKDLLLNFKRGTIPLKFRARRFLRPEGHPSWTPFQSEECATLTPQVHGTEIDERCIPMQPL